jgi:hypothetical protein
MEHQIEKLGFKPIDSLRVSHKAKHKEQVFSIHLMWMPRAGNSEPPSWDRQKGSWKGKPFASPIPYVAHKLGKEMSS